MFKETISKTGLTTETANEFFKDKISGNYYGSDVSLIATLRALIAPRMPEGDSIVVNISGFSYSKDQIDREGYRSALPNIARYINPYEAGRLYITNLTGYDEDNEECFKVLREQFINQFGSEWKLLDDVTNLYKKSFNVMCFVNPESKNTAIFVGAMNNRKFHYLQCAILGMVPWYFDKEKGISDLERNLIYSLREKTPDTYLELINEIAKQYDFETQRLRRLLGGIESRIEKKELDNLMERITSWNDRIRGLNDEIGSCLRDINDANIRVLGLRMSIENKKEESEIFQYFLCNKHLYLENVQENYIYFDVKDYLTFFDEDLVKRVLDNDCSYAYSYIRYAGISKEEMKQTMAAIFIDQEIKIKTCASYRFDMRGNVRAQSNHSFPQDFHGYMPNIHINNYSCMGGYERVINNCLRESNYIGAFEQCVASCKSLNWGDSTVMDTFFKTVCQSTAKYYELPDGTCVSFKDAVKWVKEQNEPQKEEEGEAKDGEDN